MDLRVPATRAVFLALLLGGASASSAQDFAAGVRGGIASALKDLRGAQARAGKSQAAVRARARALPETATTTFHLSRGLVTAAVNWTSDPFTGEDVLHGRIVFAPNASAPACGPVRMVQVARVEAAPGRDLDWGTGESNRNLMRTAAEPARGILPGYFVDHDAFKCRPGAPCSPYYRDSWANPDESSDGESSASGRRAASLADYPFGWQGFERITLEACARCSATGEFLGCVDWGGDWPPTGPRTLLTPSASEIPSPTFLEALARFQAFYAPSGS